MSTATTTATDWRPIRGHDGRYSLAPDGRVRSEHRRVPGRATEVPERILRPITHKPSGLTSVLLAADGAQRRHYIHRLIAETFPELTAQG